MTEEAATPWAGAAGLSESRLQPPSQPQVPRWHFHTALSPFSSILTDRLSSLLLPPLQVGQMSALYWAGA